MPGQTDVINLTNWLIASLLIIIMDGFIQDRSMTLKFIMTIEYTINFETSTFTISYLKKNWEVGVSITHV